MVLAKELGELKRYVENGEFLIEASDLGVVNMCAERKLPFVAGHALNCYNAVTLKILLKQGMMRWCMPVELSRDWAVAGKPTSVCTQWHSDHERLRLQPR